MHERPRIPVLFGTSNRFTGPDEVWTVCDALGTRERRDIGYSSQTRRIESS
jgi:hypothetical protein